MFRCFNSFSLVHGMTKVVLDKEMVVGNQEHQKRKGRGGEKAEKRCGVTFARWGLSSCKWLEGDTDHSFKKRTQPSIADLLKETQRKDIIKQQSYW